MRQFAVHRLRAIELGRTTELIELAIQPIVLLKLASLNNAFFKNVKIFHTEIMNAIELLSENYNRKEQLRKLKKYKHCKFI